MLVPLLVRGARRVVGCVGHAESMVESSKGRCRVDGRVIEGSMVRSMVRSMGRSMSMGRRRVDGSVVRLGVAIER